MLGTVDPLAPGSDHRLYVPTESGEATLDTLGVGLRMGCSPILVSGPSGIGKTLLLSVLAEREWRSFPRTRFLRLSGTAEELPGALLRVLFDVMPPRRARAAEAALLGELRNTGTRTLLLLDDAHSLSESALRKLAQLARAAKPALAVVIAGTSCEDRRDLTNALGAGLSVLLPESLPEGELAVIYDAIVVNPGLSARVRDELGPGDRELLIARAHGRPSKLKTEIARRRRPLGTALPAMEAERFEPPATHPPVVAAPPEPESLLDSEPALPAIEDEVEVTPPLAPVEEKPDPPWVRPPRLRAPRRRALAFARMFMILALASLEWLGGLREPAALAIERLGELVTSAARGIRLGIAAGVRTAEVAMLRARGSALAGIARGRDAFRGTGAEIARNARTLGDRAARTGREAARALRPRVTASLERLDASLRHVWDWSLERAALLRARLVAASLWLETTTRAGLHSVHGAVLPAAALLLVALFMPAVRPLPRERVAASALGLVAHPTLAAATSTAPAPAPVPPIPKPALPAVAARKAAAPVEVHVNARPWAHVRIDDQDAGPTPLRRRLSPGRHQLVAQFPDGRRIERSIQVGPKQRFVSLP
jgi:AAA domain-containing protein